MIPALIVSIWMWLPTVSGLLLKAARHLDIGFQWFNSHFDIEKKPLQSIGPGGRCDRSGRVLGCRDRPASSVDPALVHHCAQR
jgi:hypothetical protein